MRTRDSLIVLSHARLDSLAAELAPVIDADWDLVAAVVLDGAWGDLAADDPLRERSGPLDDAFADRREPHRME